MQTVLCLNFFDDAHYYYLDWVLGASVIGYDVLKMLRQLHRSLAIFSTNKDVTGFHARDDPNSIVNKTHTVNMGAGIFYASTVRNDLQCRPFSI